MFSVYMARSNVPRCLCSAFTDTVWSQRKEDQNSYMQADKLLYLKMIQADRHRFGFRYRQVGKNLNSN